MHAISVTCENLDKTFALIKSADTLDKDTRLYLQNQSVIYMTYLDDLAEGRMDTRKGHADDMTSLIDEFCSMIQNELQGNAAGSRA